MNTKALKENFSNKSVLVIGDIMLDEYIYGEVHRISPEAPVPVIHAKKIHYTAGGAANVILNLHSLGARPLLMGLIGKDESGEKLKAIFRRDLELPEEDVFLLERSNYPTIKKTRVIGENQQICRIDWEDKSALQKEEEKNLLAFIEKNISRIDAVLISDYGKGLITSSLMQQVTALGKKHNIIITVDPQKGHFSIYKNVTALTPNHLEAETGSAIAFNSEEDLLRGGRKLMKELNCDYLLITRGKDGMSLFDRQDNVSHFPTVARQVFDVTGAGDTVISVFTLALASHFTLDDCCTLANKAGGVVVGKMGVVPIKLEELR